MKESQSGGLSLISKVKNSCINSCPAHYAMGFGLAGLFFVRFWRKTGNRLFALFSLALFVMSANRIELARSAVLGTGGDHSYWIRFVAFALILTAILDKNWYRKPAA